MTGAEEKTVLARLEIRTVQGGKMAPFGDPSAAQVLLHRALFRLKPPK